MSLEVLKDDFLVVGDSERVGLRDFPCHGTELDPMSSEMYLGNKFIGVFTPTVYCMYDRDSAMAALRSLASTGIEAERGLVQNGIYVRS